MATKVIYRRRRRQAPASHDAKFFKKETGQEQSFFGNSQHDTFFQNQQTTVQRKCDRCEGEEKEVKRSTDKKEEEKNVHRMEDKKEEDKKVHRKEDKKEDKEVHRAADKKEEEKNVHRKEEKKENKEVHRKAEAASTPATATASSYISSMNGKGSALPASAKQFFQNSMGADFSDVKIHTGTQAEQSASAINAKAYTVDNNIVFAANQFNPDTKEGKKLLAHELTHVMQQSGGVMRKVASHHPAAPPEGELENTIGHISGTRPAQPNAQAYGAGDVSVKGRTDANYQNSEFSTEDVVGQKAKGCKHCSHVPCANVKGTLVSVFKANPTVTLPTMPEGLNPCQQQKVRTFIDTTLTAHENQHVEAFNTYNGVVRTQFDYTGCYTERSLHDYLQPIHDKIDKQRVDAANALSKKLDPPGGFVAHIDTESCLETHTPPVVHHPTPPPHH